MRRLLARPARLLRRFQYSTAGVAAVEFALVLTAMMPMFYGLSEVVLGVNTNRKLVLASRSLADLSSRTKTIATADMADIFSAATIVMQPFNVAKLKMVVSQMYVTQVGTSTTFNATVDWSCASGPGAVVKPAGTYTVPVGFKKDKSYYMLVETSLPYTPMFGKTITGTINLGQTVPWPIRDNSKVTRTGACPS